MSQSLFRIAAPINPALRAEILVAFKPHFSTICCDTISYAFRVAHNFVLPFLNEVLLGEVYGHHVGDGFDSLLVSINGQRFRPDGRRLSLTLSLAPGVDRASALLDRNVDFKSVEGSLGKFGLQFHRVQLSNLSALKQRVA